MHSRQIESFIATADAGSFSKAAQSLYIAPSSLIQQIDLLERRLGLTLFERGPRGVKLTDSGKSLYRDAQDIVRQCDEAIARARRIQEGNGQIRVATSLLMKCRMLPGIWSHMIEKSPGIRIDIISLESAKVKPGNYLQGLGTSYDVMEGLYMSELYRDECLFLELAQVPVCIAMPKEMLSERQRGSRSGKRLQADGRMLENLDLVMMRPGVSAEYDAVRSHLIGLSANKITDIPFYTMELFADCALNKRAIVTTEIWEDIHPDLECVPLVKPHSIPYGLIFEKNPSPQAMELFQTAKRMQA